MAFTGAAVIKQVSDNLVRITGLSLASEGAAGTIGLFEKLVAPDVRLPESFKARPYKRPDEAIDVSLQDAVEVTFVYVNGGATLNAISVVKTGTTPADFVATLTNNTAVEAGDSGALEIYVRYH